MLQFLLVLAIIVAGLPATAAGEIKLSQADGNNLTLKGPARTVVALSPHLTEMIYAAGAGERIVATVEYSEFPESARDIPRIGDAFRLDIERILALDADLVVAWASGNPAPALEQLTRLGKPVWSVEIREPGQIADILDAMGMAFDTAAEAGRQASRIRERLAELAGTYPETQRVSYFYQVGERPLFTINGDHLISKGLAICGGRNVFDGERGLAFQVGYESVLLADPDVMFAPGQQGESDPLADWRQWSGLAAVRNDRLFLLPADSISRATPRFLDSLELACKLMHRPMDRRTNE